MCYVIKDIEILLIETNLFYLVIKPLLILLKTK